MLNIMGENSVVLVNESSFFIPNCIITGMYVDMSSIQKAKIVDTEKPACCEV